MSKCIICTAEHSHLWTDGTPNIYCSDCEKLREQSTGTTTQVMPGLYLGDMVAASHFDGSRLCVYDDPPTYQGEYEHIPILSETPPSRYDRSARVDRVQLAKALEFIDDLVSRRQKLMVHCHGGVERSPLTMAVYLNRYRGYPSLTDAYAYLKSIRPVVAYRGNWLW